MFQSHLRPIHPIHKDTPFAVSPFFICFNRICAPFTLSTQLTIAPGASVNGFQSHLRPIHPIHFGFDGCVLSISIVSIASAPHSPYPPSKFRSMSSLLSRFNRICAPFTLSTERGLGWMRLGISFQSHLRPIHPIHACIPHL